MKDHNKKRLKFIITWGIPTSLIVFLFPGLLTWEWPDPAYLFLTIPMMGMVILLSTIMYERPTYIDKNKKPSPYYTPHLDNMGAEVRERIETKLKEIHPLIKLTDEKYFGDVVLEMPAYVEGNGLFATHHRKYRIIFDTHYKKIRFELNSSRMDPKLIMCITLITIGLGWQKEVIDFKDFVHI